MLSWSQDAAAELVALERGSDTWDRPLGSVLADVAATIGDAEGAARLLGLLAPHAARHVVLNCFGGGGSYWGPVATQMGRLAALCGDDDAASAHYSAARRAARAFGAPLALARVPPG